MKKYLFLLITVLIGILTVKSHAQSAPDKNPDKITNEMIGSLIDSIDLSLKRNYIFPDSVAKMISYVRDLYKKGAYKNITNPRELGDQIEHDLQKAHHDGHLKLFFAPGMAQRLKDTAGEVERRHAEDSIALAKLREMNFFFPKVEIYPGNIGYAVLNGFTGFVDEARPTFTAAFRFLSQTDALIIDLRNNGGGSPDMVNQVESYFFNQKTHLNDIVDRLAGKKIEFWTDPLKADSVFLSMPVYILTSRGTFSGAEDFAYGLQSVKRAVIVGDTTGGGAHPVRPFPIGRGFVAAIPFARSLNPYTHTDWEGTGIIPDIHVSSDNAMEAAERAIYSSRMANAKSAQEKRSIQWFLDNLLALQSDKKPDSNILKTYVGNYLGGLDFYIKENELYCRNEERGGMTFKLKYMTGDQFILDENVHVEFTKNETATIAGINMLWINGNVSFKPLNKDVEKRKIIWETNYQKSVKSNLHISGDSLKQYAGIYEGGLDFYIKGNNLYCKNAERGNEIFKLRPIGDSLFLLDENVQVEFVKDGLNMNWKNGELTFKKKVK